MEQGVLAPAPIWSDVKTFTELTPYFRNKVHGIIGGYPCQPFSAAGQRQGTEDPRHLFPYISSIINTIRPVWCFFENVSGHLSMGYEQVYRSLRDLGYRVEAGIYTAEQAGAPHQRERLFILAIRSGTNLVYPEGWRTRGLRDEIGERQGYGITGTSGVSGEENMGDTNTNRSSGEAGLDQWQKSGQEQSGIWDTTQSTGEIFRGFEMGNTNSDGNSSRDAIGSDKDNSGQTEGEENQRERIWAEPSSAGETMANTNSNGSGESVERSELRTAGTKQSSSDSRTANERENDQGRFDRWPAKPGQDQFDWEEPRTIPKKIRRKSGTKSGMGTTINGYNFREDLLRMAGNGVVEQTAEIAFIDLLKKHGIKL